MENKQLKSLIDILAQANGFNAAFGGWFKESPECIIVLDLQKSNFGNLYYLNIKFFVQGAFGKHYSKNKDLVKKDVGTIFRRQPKEYEAVFDLEVPMTDNERTQKLEELFLNFIAPLTDKALTKAGIKELEEKGKMHQFPGIKNELDKICELKKN